MVLQQSIVIFTILLIVRGGFRLKDLGQTCSGRRGSDDNITLHSRKFQIGDYLDVAISTRPIRSGAGGRDRPY